MNHYVDAFLREVLEKVKYKKMHPYLAQELNDHIESLKEELIEEGMTEEAAYEQAVLQMGEASVVGEGLHSMHKPRVEWSIMILLAALLSIGLYTLFVFSKNFSGSNIGDYYFRKQLVMLVLGVVGFSYAYFIDYRKLEKWSWVLYMIGLGMIMLMMVIGVEVNGVKRWLRIGPIVIQPVMIAVPIFLVSHVGFIRKWANQGYKGYIKLFALIILAFGACALNSPQYAIALLLGTITCFVLYVCSDSFKGSRKKILSALSIIILYMVTVIIYNVVTVDYRLERVKAWLNPEIDPRGAGWFVDNIREINEGASWIGNGGLKHLMAQKGITGGIWQPYGAEGATDFIFNFIVGAMGILVAALVILMVGLLLIRCFKSAYSVRDDYGKWLLIGISSLLTCQFILGIVVNMGWLPTITTHIPFLSYGGSALVSDLMMMGLFLGIYRRKDICPAELIQPNKPARDNKLCKYKLFRLLTPTQEETEIDLELEEGMSPQRKLAELALEILQDSDEVAHVEVIFKEKATH